MSVFLCIICLIWLAFVQQKLDKISRSIDYLLKASANLDKPKTVASVEPVEKMQEAVEVPKTEEKTEQIIEQNNVESVTLSDETPVSNTETVAVRKIIDEPKNDFELQNVFLGNVFNKIGAVAIIVAMIIFLKLVSPFIVITPLMKTIFGFIAGLGMAGGALFMHSKENLKRYSEVLLGTGFATLFITTFCAYSIFHLFNTATVLVVGALLLLSTFVLAQQMKTISMLFIGLIGGYLTPCFSGASYDVCLYFLIFLNAVSLVYTLKNQRFAWINIINLIITMFAFIPYVIEPMQPIFPVVLWGIYILYDLLRDKSCKAGYSVSIINYVVLTFFSMLLFRSSHAFLGYMLAVAALVYYGMAFYSYVSKNELYKTYVYYILLNLWLEIVFLLNDVQSVIAWSLIGFVLALFSAKFNRKYLNTGMYMYFSSAFLGALLAKSGSEFVMFTHYAPILNIRTLVFACPVTSLMLSALLFKNKNENNSNFLFLSGLSLGYLYIVGELNSIITDEAGGNNFVRAMLYSIVGFSYVLQTKKLYKLNNNILYNVASWVILPISLLVLFIWSIGFQTQTGYMPVINLRFAAYVMGILTAIVCARWMNSEFYKYLAVILGFILAHCESVGIAHLADVIYIISVAWVLYSGIVTISGILLNRRYLINSGIFLVILSILRIFIYDLANVEALYKLVAFLALGIILMLVSYIYTSNQKKLK